MKVIYVAGPYSADNEYGVKLNIRAAEDAAVDIWKAGAVAICPHLNTAHWGNLLSHQEFVDGDLEIVRRCDAVFMVDGWERSSGANRERACALDNGLPVFMFMDVLREWLKNRATLEAL